MTALLRRNAAMNSAVQPPLAAVSGLPVAIGARRDPAIDVKELPLLYATRAIGNLEFA
jgi:hypothetical protein